MANMLAKLGQRESMNLYPFLHTKLTNIITYSKNLGLNNRIIELWNSKYNSKLNSNYISSHNKWIHQLFPYVMDFDSFYHRTLKHLSSFMYSKLYRIFSHKISLNYYLFQMKLTSSPLCSHCNQIDDIYHFFMVCTHYTNQRITLFTNIFNFTQNYYKLNDITLKLLLTSNLDILRFTEEYIKSTKSNL